MVTLFGVVTHKFEGGRLFSWGMGYFGCSGHNSDNHVLEPQIIATLEGKKIVDFQSGDFYTMVLTEGMKVAVVNNNSN